MGTGNMILEAEDRGYWEPSKNICLKHADNEIITKLITDNMSEAKCDYCETLGTEDEPVAAPLASLMDAIMVGINLFYEPAAESGVDTSEVDLTTKYDPHDVAHEVIDLLDSIYEPDRELVADIAAALTCQLWVDRNWQRLPPDLSMQYGWDSFKSVVKHQSRFLLMGLPGDEDDNRLTAVDLFKDLVAMIVDVPGLFPVPCPSPLYRGRMFATDPEVSKFASAAELGSPPHGLAAANRMSPAGISMFYGGTELATAIAEIGAHSSYAHAISGEFSPAQELRLLDFSHLDDVPTPNIFDKDQHRAYFSLRFLRNFVKDLTLPVELDGREHIDYVPTQVFTEYLRYAFPGGRIDGLMFPSTQAAGCNVVIFCGPEQCEDKGSVGPYTMLSLDPSTVKKHRVTSVIREPEPPTVRW